MFSGTPAGLGVSSGLYAPGSADAGGMHAPATVVLLAPGLGTPCFGNFPPTPRSPLSGLAAPSAQRDVREW